MSNQEHLVGQSTGKTFRSTMIEGPVYNGTYMTKLDLMQYLEEAIRLYNECENYMNRMEERKSKREKLERQLNRNTYRVSTMEKPTGLSALSGKKRRAYKEWVDGAGERERKKAEFEKAEDERVQKVQEEIAQMNHEEEGDRAVGLSFGTLYCDHMLKHVLAPEYRKGKIPVLLLKYLKNGRAHTLQEAIAIYHKELHWHQMENIAEMQRKEIMEANHRREAMAWEMMEEQRELMESRNSQLESIASDARMTRYAAEDAEFWIRMSFFMD